MRSGFRKAFWACAIGLSCALVAACGSEQKPVDRVGVNVVEKSVFDGSWYMSRTVVGVQYEASGLGTFPGDAASDSATTFTAIPRVRFVIDEKTLYAYRDYAIVSGGDGDGHIPAEQSSTLRAAEKEKLFGQPVAAFRIEKHFDVRRDYNPSTGEERNVIVENDTDKPWYARKYMRVDWSKNLLPGYFGQTANLYELLGNYTREPADLFVQDQSQFPASYNPRFDRMHCDGRADDSPACSDVERDFAADYPKDELYHMSFVSQEILSPGRVNDPETGAEENWCTAKLYSDAPPCSSIVSYVRTSFLKVSDQRQYEPLNYVDTRFDKFGFFRLSEPTVDRSNGKPSDPAFGRTDFLNYNVNRHNLWLKWHDERGKPLPYGERTVRPIVWYTTPELPAHLVEPSFDVASEWNEILMETVRKLRGQALPKYPDVKCQDSDPDAYCACERAANGVVQNPTCPGHYDFETKPSAYGEGTENPYDCYLEVPKAAQKLDWNDPKLGDSDFNPWFGAKLVGKECVNVLRVNACNKASIAANGGTTAGLTCEERGDLRYKFLSYVAQPGTDFLGIATPRGDPVTGEIIASDANIGGPALDGYRTSALDTYDLVAGNTSELDVQVGEDVRSYFENLGRVDLPARPRVGFSQASFANAADDATRNEIDRRMKGAGERLQKLSGPDGRQATFSERRDKLIGSDLERRLVAGLGAAQTADGAPLSVDPTQLTDAELDQLSPLRLNMHDRLAALKERDDRFSRAGMELPNEYTDDSVERFAGLHKDYTRARLQLSVNRLLFRQTVLHEMGHCLGLRHDFGASADSEHYQDRYYEIAERTPLPAEADFDKDGKTGLSASESIAFEKAYETARKTRELAGIDGAMSSSVMEYTANWYERLQPLGRYDRAAIQFGYGDLVEAYRGEAKHDAPRATLRYYQGGEPCNVDADCPYAMGGAHVGDLLGENRDQQLTQRCIAASPDSSAKLCSSLDEDLAASAAKGGPLKPLHYRFCTDERADTTLGWCNRFDEGESYREIVRNIADSYDRMYLFSAFRRYRKTFGTSSYADQLLSRRLGILQNVYQNLVYEYLNDPKFRAQNGAFGFYDQFLATTDILNFYAHVLAQPNVGGYAWNEQTSTYERAYVDPANGAADLSVPLGLGRYFYSDYQSGLSGFERLERVGSIFDKSQVIGLLTERGASSDYTRDVAFYSNFYDLFPNEMQQIFTGMIRNAPEAYMPRLACANGSKAPACDDAQLVYMDFYRGDCTDTGNQATCKPNPATSTYAKLPILDGGGSIILQIYAALYGLSDFPVYFDTTFQNQLFVCIEGQADCHAPSPTSVEGKDYVRFTSPRYRRTFIAWQVEPQTNAGGASEQTSIGFSMVKEAADLQTILLALTKLRDGKVAYSKNNLSQAELEALAALGYVLPSSQGAIDSEIDRVDTREQDLESFFNQLIELQREYGIKGIQYFGN